MIPINIISTSSKVRGSRTVGYEEQNLVGCNAVYFGKDSQSALLASCFLLAYSLTLKAETICSSEASVDFY
jgi:hypothetical protein